MVSGKSSGRHSDWDENNGMFVVYFDTQLMNDTLMTCTCSFDYLIFMFSRAQAISSGVVTLDKLALHWETFSKLCNTVLLNLGGNQGNIVLFAVVESK